MRAMNNIISNLYIKAWKENQDLLTISDKNSSVIIQFINVKFVFIWGIFIWLIGWCVLELSDYIWNICIMLVFIFTHRKLWITHNYKIIIDEWMLNREKLIKQLSARSLIGKEEFQKLISTIPRPEFVYNI